MLWHVHEIQRTMTPRIFLKGMIGSGEERTPFLAEHALATAVMKEQCLEGRCSSTAAAAEVRWIVEHPGFITVLEMALLLIAQS